MGRYKRGSKYHHRGQNRRKSEKSGDVGDGNISCNGSLISMVDSDWTLLEKYLLEYRKRAYQAYHCKQNNKNGDVDPLVNDSPIVISKHIFLPLTLENCQRPYLDLPDTLSSNERRKVHAMCAYIDLYHDTSGGETNQTSGKGNESNDENNGAKSPPPPSTRRISVSIYEDGLRMVPNRDAVADVSHSSFPLQKCRPWYYRAYGNSTKTSVNIVNEDEDGQYKRRRDAIEVEKKQIRQFANLPEQLLLSPTDDDDPTASRYNLDFNILDQLNLSMEPTPDETPWVLVDTVEKLKSCVNELMYGVDDNIEQSPKIRELAFDLEMHNDGKVGGSGTRTCLIQLTSDVATITVDESSGSPKKVYKDYIIDPLAPGVWDAIPMYLGPIFSDPNIIKIGHGIGGMDTTSLHRDFGILIVNAFDTYEASSILSQRKRGMGLVALCHHYGLPSWEHYKELKHTFQCSDWRKRPLEKRALEYGRFDIRYLVPLRTLLIRDLVKMDMLHSRGYFRVNSSEEDESGVDSASERETALDSFDIQGDSVFTSSASSIAEEIDMPSENHSVEQLENFNDDMVASSTPTEKITSPKPVILASELPCYHHLMKAISMSQKRCLKLWSGDEEEPILKNQSLVSMMKHAASGTGYGKHWTDEHLRLYRQLTEWRVKTAQRESSSLSDICTLDILVYAAYKTPTSRCEMRRYSYVLPIILEDETLPYFDELCDLVMTSDAFHRRQSLSLPETLAVVKFSDRCLHGNNVRQRRVAKLVVISAVIGVLAVVMRARRR